MTTETEQFDKDTQQFDEITVGKAQEMIDTLDRVIIFVGRKTCPFCRLFASKLSPIAKESEEPIYYLNSEAKNDLEAIKVFRDKYDIPTVPGFLVKKNDEITVKCDSSLPVAQIKELIA
ncbi:MAG: thioredoxin [Bavariicoccus seileri]|uniref:thioredoxin n=1 Tax=Bavariicoccus seileri TaxID=549685 RepID=UPI003F8F22E9